MNPDLWRIDEYLYQTDGFLLYCQVQWKSATIADVLGCVERLAPLHAELAAFGEDEHATILLETLKDLEMHAERTVRMMRELRDDLHFPSGFPSCSCISL